MITPEHEERPGRATEATSKPKEHLKNTPVGVDVPSLAVATAPRTNSVEWTTTAITWGKFLRKLAHPADHKECGNYVFGPVDGKRRNKNTVLSRSALTIDVDHAKEGFLGRLEAFLTKWGWAGAVHTTFSHTPGEPRYRVVIPFDAEISPHDFRTITQWVWDEIGDRDEFDDSCDQPERFMFWPSTERPHEYVHRVFSGAPMDTAAALLLAPEIPERPVVAGSSVYNGPAFVDLPADRQEAARDIVESDIKRWRERLAETVEWPDGQTDDQRPPRGWEALTRDASFRFAHLALAPWSPFDEDEMMARYFDEVIPEDYLKAPKCNVDEKWSNDLRKLKTSGECATTPWSDPADDFDVVPPETTFFDETPILKHIQRAAHSRLGDAPSLLAAILIYVIDEIHPEVLLPPTVAAAASLNLGIALTGDSGDGKTSSFAVGSEVIDRDHYRTRPIGSGEGLIDSYYDPRATEEVNGKTVRVRRLYPVDQRHFIFTADEAETMSALGDRKGTTLGPILRSALTGGELGTTNAMGNGTDRLVPRNEYRATMVINVHPDKADVLLDGGGVGTPQRFLWMPTTDNELPRDEADAPEWPGPLPTIYPERISPGIVKYPDHVRREIRQARLNRRHNPDSDPREGHAMLTRLKVAFALAVLHGEDEITDQWWGLAGELMVLSLRTQDECEKRLNEVKGSRHIAQARAVARAAEVVEDDRLAKAVRAVVEKLRKRPGVVHSWEEAKPAHRRTVGLETSDIVDALREQAGVTVVVREGRNKQPAYDLQWSPK